MEASSRAAEIWKQQSHTKILLNSVISRNLHHFCSVPPKLQKREGVCCMLYSIPIGFFPQNQVLKDFLTNAFFGEMVLLNFIYYLLIVIPSTFWHEIRLHALTTEAYNEIGKESVKTDHFPQIYKRNPEMQFKHVLLWRSHGSKCPYQNRGID